MSVTETRQPTPENAPAAPPRHRDRTRWLYLSVIVAIVAGIALGAAAPEAGRALKPLGDLFVALVKMMIAPIIFCTIFLGVGSVKRAASVGKVGGIALAYFVVLSTAALAVGLVVGNVIHPGDRSHLTIGHYTQSLSKGYDGFWGMLIPGPDASPHSIVPTTLLSPLTSSQVLQTLFVALLCGFAVLGLGEKGEPIIRAVGHVQKLVFRVLAMVMWVAPIGAFGAMAAVVGTSGWSALGSLGLLMLAFYTTCVLFVLVVLGTILRLVTGVSVFSLLRYLAREFLLIFSTSSSETALPRLIAKMEHLGVARPVVGIVVPTGYSFNLDGTAIYLTMSSLFIAEALGTPMNLGQQIALLVFMIIASKGAAGVSGAGIATLAAGLQSQRPDLLDGVSVVMGIDKFMSEARALTNFAGNAVATLVVGTWVGQVDRAQVREVLSGRAPFDEATMSE